METTVGFWLVSTAFSNALRSAGATGWSLRPAVVFEKRQRREFHGFSLFFPEGRAGPPRWDLAPREVRPPSGPGTKPYTVAVGLILDANLWDRSDVFWPGGTTFTCMTTKAAQAIERASLSNVRLIPAEKFEIWEAAFAKYD